MGYERVCYERGCVMIGCVCHACKDWSASFVKDMGHQKQLQEGGCHREHELEEHGLEPSHSAHVRHRDHSRGSVQMELRIEGVQMCEDVEREFS